jgi:hypothetical protein
MKRTRKVIYGGTEGEGETVELTAVDANGIKAKINDIDMKGDLKVIHQFVFNSCHAITGYLFAKVNQR